jgi:GrpB-like predicted nucleotidyltransferase (UPF0157 family)
MSASDPVVIVPYREEWPREFRALATEMRRALPADVTLRFDHIGSTAVPGLAAKDTLDVQITVPGFGPDVLRALECLAPLGFTLADGIQADHVPPGWEGAAEEWEKRYLRRRGPERAVNTHVRVAGRANWRYALLFRDYLRAHPDAAAGYAELKRRLSAYTGSDRDAYVEIKDPVCDILMSAAEAWAARVDWQVGPPDA